MDAEESSFLNQTQKRARILDTPERPEGEFSINVLEVNPAKHTEVDPEGEEEEEEDEDQQEQEPKKHPEEIATEKFSEFICQLFHNLRLDQRILGKDFEPKDQKNLDIWQEISEKIVANHDIITQSPHLVLFLYIMMSVDEKELFSFLQIFTSKFDSSQIYMMNFDQFSGMIQSMARKHGVSFMSEYFRYLDRYNYQQAVQKDRFFSVTNTRAQYFGPFMLQGIFEIVQGDYPVDTNNGVEYYTDFWKMLSFNMNLMFFDFFKKSFKLRDEYHVDL